MIVFNIDTTEIRDFSQRLKTLHRSALPVAIRGTLNDAAFKMKKETMPKVAKEMFEERQPNFFKANSRVEGAKGFDVKKMVSTVGFVSSGLQNVATNYAVKDLEDQEHGGIIQGRSFKPLPGARKGGTGNVRANSRISQILKAGNVIDSRDMKNKGNSLGAKEALMQKFIFASYEAGEGGYVLGGSILWRVKKIKRIGRNTFFTKEKLYSFKKSGTAKVHATGFMKKSALEVQKEMEFFYVLQANKQISKHLAKFK